MLNWWDANRFRMPTYESKRYQPSLLDFQSSPGPTDEGPSPTGYGEPYGGGSLSGRPSSPDAPTANTGRSGGGPSHSTVGGVLGTIASLAVPGAGFLGSAMGTMSDVDRANKDLSAVGRDPSLSGPSAIAGQSLFGLGEKAGFGKGIDSQVNELFGFNLGREGLAALANAAKGLDTTAYGIEQEQVMAPDTGAGLGGISPGAGGPLGTTAQGVQAGYGALGTPSGGGGPSAPSSNEGPGSMTGDAGDPGANGGPSGPWNRGGVLPRRTDTVTGPDDQIITAKSGEGIIRAEAVDHYGPGLIGAINRMKIPKKKLQSLLDVRG